MESEAVNTVAAISALDATTILGIQDTRTEKVYVPEWNGHVYVRTMTGLERDDWEKYVTDRIGSDKPIRGHLNIRAKLCSYCLSDKAGARLFNDDQVITLSQKNAKALDIVYEAALKINRLTQSEIEEIEKNSEAEPSG